MGNLAGKKVLLGVSGGIAAYKSCWLLRSFQRAGAEVRVILTASAEQFVSPLSLQALSGHAVRQCLFDEEAERAMSHIELARWADVLVIAPATANVMAKMAQGGADDLLTTVYLATEASTVLCPAMNSKMWFHPATQKNVETLQARGVRIILPEEGEQACGEEGPGRLPELSVIVAHTQEVFMTQALHGKRVIITAGPTQEPIDPVRFISNHSSGKMGYAIARAARQAGAEVILVSGPVAIAPPAGVQHAPVCTAQDMLDTVQKHLQKEDIFIATAAVADYRVTTAMTRKIKKKEGTLSLELAQNPDILAKVSASKLPSLTIGFAAETDNVLEYARQKRQKKALDYIVANEVGENKTFGQDSSSVTLIGEAEEVPWLDLPKSTIAEKLVAFIAQRLQNSAH